MVKKVLSIVTGLSVSNVIVHQDVEHEGDGPDDPSELSKVLVPVVKAQLVGHDVSVEEEVDSEDYLLSSCLEVIFIDFGGVPVEYCHAVSPRKFFLSKVQKLLFVVLF